MYNKLVKSWIISYLQLRYKPELFIPGQNVALHNVEYDTLWTPKSELRKESDNRFFVVPSKHYNEKSDKCFFIKKEGLLKYKITSSELPTISKSFPLSSRTTEKNILPRFKKSIFEIRVTFFTCNFQKLYEVVFTVILSVFSKWYQQEISAF